ncbi:MAG: hypothetical protein EBX41_04205 [Chitinophagia bacterium]|nr:hypothetical protein [Chitinophagia bacterium]
MKLVMVGPLWRGSNAGGLFRAMSRKGCLIEVIDEFYHISLTAKDLKTKIAERLIRPLQIEEYNRTIVKKIDIFSPDILFVYKGAFVKPATLEYARKKGARLVMFFPDVSTTAHGGYLPQAIPHYELIFTTKTFGIKDMKDKYGVTNSVFIPHGYDPEIHRPLPITPKELNQYGCDASFIGTWSPKKEKWLAALIAQIPTLKLKIWGEQWNKSVTDSITPYIQGTQILGDIYSLAIQCSTINLGILSEQRVGSSSGDLITSRTFHIPGAAGFMLHERNEESLKCFIEEKECAYFEGTEEMATQVQKYLAHPALREQIKEAGYKRALAEHSLDARADTVISHLNKL